MSEHNEFPHPEFLASTGWLAERLEDDNLQVVDCDLPDQYRRAHVPGATFMDDHYQKDPDANRVHIMGPDAFALMAQSLGIGDDTLVVAYDNSMGLYAARLWWALNYYGHANVKVLNGGWRKWLSEGRPVTDAPAKPPSGRVFTPRLDPSFMVTADQLKEDYLKPNVVAWDVRSLGENLGHTTRGNRRPGRIPNAVHLEWLELVDHRTHLLKPAAEMRRILQSHGITPDKRVHSY